MAARGKGQGLVSNAGLSAGMPDLHRGTSYYCIISCLMHVLRHALQVVVQLQSMAVDTPRTQLEPRMCQPKRLERRNHSVCLSVCL